MWTSHSWPVCRENIASMSVMCHKTERKCKMCKNKFFFHKFTSTSLWIQKLYHNLIILQLCMKTNPPCTLSLCALLNLVSPWMSSLHWYKPVLKTLALCSWYTKSSEEPMVLVYTILSFFNMVYSRISPLPVLVLTVAWHLRVTLVPAVTSFLGSMISSTLWILNSMKWDLTKSVRTHLSDHISSA